MEIFEYKTKLSYTNFITPAIGAFSIYMAFTNNAGLAYRGKLVLPYPASSFFYGIVGFLMLIPLVFTYLKSRKGHLIEFKTKGLTYTKGTFITKQVKIEYKDIQGVSFEEDDDDGSSIIIDIGKIVNSEFYAEKFKSNAEYIKFCDRINKVTGN